MAESLFPTRTPTDNVDANGAPGISLCTLFVPSVNGTVSHIRRYRSTTAPTFAVGSLWARTSDAAGTLLASGSTWDGGGVGGAAGWDTVPLSGGPVAVTAGLTYYAELTTDRFCSDTTASPLRTGSVVSGNLTAPQNDNVIPRQNGRFASNNNSTPTYPNDNSNLANFYFVDVVFTAAAGATQNGNATLAGAASILVTAAVSPGGAASVAASATITATAAVTRNAVAALAATATITAAASLAAGATVQRPNTGTTTRPGSGGTSRPYTGVIPRP